MSRFFGVIIRMYTETGVQHQVPHIHAYYHEHKATYRIDTAELLVGSLPLRQQRLMEAWIELYREELLENWSRADAGEPIERIPPLTRE